MSLFYKYRFGENNVILLFNCFVLYIDFYINNKNHIYNTLSTNHVVAHQKMVLPSCHILESLSSPREDMDKRNN